MTNELYTDNLTCPFHLNSPTQKEARLRALITEVTFLHVMGKQSTAIHRLCSEMEASKACQEECFFFYEKTCFAS